MRTIEDYKKILQLPQIKSFLSLIGFSEGANYNTLFGGSTFTDYSKKPTTIIHKSGYSSSAAGRYQIINSTWQQIQNNLHLPDFSPTSQDIAALYLIDRRNALDYIIKGNIEAAITTLSYEWASFPPSRYNQPTRSMTTLLSKYKSFLKKKINLIWFLVPLIFLLKNISIKK
jgi:muramidase (phage lysozyme)